MSDSDLTGAAVPLKIIGEKKTVIFQASPLNDRDYDELDNYIRAQLIDVAKQNLIGLSPGERSEMLQAAIKAAASSGWGTLEGSKIISTVEGSMRLGWQMVKAMHPQVSWEEFLNLGRTSNSDLTGQNIEAIDIAFGTVNLGLKISEEPKEDSSETTKS